MKPVKRKAPSKNGSAREKRKRTTKVARSAQTGEFVRVSIVEPQTKVTDSVGRGRKSTHSESRYVYLRVERSAIEHIRGRESAPLVGHVERDSLVIRTREGDRMRRVHEAHQRMIAAHREAFRKLAQ